MKNIILRSITLILLSICALISVVVSAYAAKDFNIKNNTQNYFHVDGATGNIGIGTTTPQGAFVVTNGNVGIGTWATSNNMLNVRGRVGIGTTYASYYSAPANGLLIEGNTGIGTYAPSAALHVRSAGATTPLIVTSAFSSTTPIMSIDGVGNLIYGPTVSSGGSQSMIDFGNNVAATTGSADFFLINPSSNNTAGIFKVAKSSFSYFEIDTNGKVGIGTVSQGSLLSVLGGASLGVYARSAAPAGGLIASGNVGVGTIGPASKMAVVGNIGVGTGINSSYVTTAAPSGGMIIEGNVGLGTTTPQDKLIVLGGNVGIGTWTADNASLETTGLRLIGNGAAAGSVLVSSSTGIGTWMAPGTISSSAASGWSTGTGTVYNTTGSDNVGVGTTTPQGGFVVTNGNVGIGTWAPQSLLDVYGAGDAYFTTNVGIGSVNPTQALDVVGTGKFSVAVNAPAISNLTSNGFVKTSGGTGTLSVDTNTYPSYSSMTTNYLQKATSSSAVGNSSIFDNGNVGIGTTTPQGGLVVTNGNVGIGTWATVGGRFIVKGPGNVGIGTSMPESLLTVNGTSGIISDLTTNSSQTSFFKGNYNGSNYFNILFGGSNEIQFSITDTVDNTNGNYFIQKSGETFGRAVFGRSFLAFGPGNTTRDAFIERSSSSTFRISSDQSTGAANLLVTGNLGLGTLTPSSKLTVAGGLGIGTGLNTQYVTTSAPTGGMIVEGNVGFGTTTPKAKLAVVGGNVGIGTWTADTASLETTGLRLIGNGAAAGSVLVSTSTGIGTWMAPGTISSSGAASGWSTGTGTVYNSTGSDNVGIGTTTPQGGLVVTNGNVGIGTWTTAGGNLIVMGNIGIGTSILTGYQLDIFDRHNAGNGSAIVMNLASSGASSGSGYGGIDINNTLGDNAFMNRFGVRASAYQYGLIGKSLGNNGSTMGSAAGWFTIPPAAVLGESTGTTTGSAIVGASDQITTSDLMQLLQGGSSFTGNGLTMSFGNQGSGGSFSGNFLNLKVNTVNKFVINSSGNIGIGTLTPVNAIDVVGGVGIGTGINTAYLTSSAPAGGMIVQGNVGLGTTTPQDKLIVVGGNVGIGTWTAATASLETTGLRLIGNGATAGSVLVSSSTGIGTWMAASTLATSGAASGWSTGTGTVYNTTGSDKVGIGTTTPQGGFVVTNGNVGIGTWAPQALLDVYGTSDTYFTTNVGIGSVNPTQSLDVVGTGKFSTGVNAPKLTNLTSNGFVKTGSGDGTLSVDTNTYPSYSSMTTNYLQKSTSSSAVGDSSIFDNGNVGIGTTTPQASFVVYGGGKVGIGTFAPYSLIQTQIQSAGSVTTLGVKNLTNGTGIAEFGGTSTGDVSGIRFYNADSTAFNSISLGFRHGQTIGQAGAPQGWFKAYLPSGTANTEFGFLTSAAGYEALRIKASGNVGIGTIEPGSLLSVAGGVGVGTGPNTAYVSTAAPAGGMIIQGNVGIGTTTPQSNLSILGGNVGIGTWTAENASLETTGLRLIGNGAAAGSVLVSSSTGIGTWMAASTLATSGAASGWSTGTGTVYNTTGSDKVGIGTTTPQGGFVVTNGNLGIGTWSPGSKLEINGFGTTQPSLTVNAGAQQSSSTYPVQIKGSYNGLGFNALYLENSGTATGTNVSVQFGNGANGAVAGITGTKTSDSYGALGFSTADTVGYLERMRITASGSVGVGTYTPQGGFVVTNGNVGIGTWAPNSTFTFRGSQSASLVTLAADTTLGTSQYTVLVDSTSSAITITLPTAVGITGRCYRVKDWKGQSTVNNITVATTGAETIDSAASLVMNVAYQGAEFCSDGANWSIF